MVRGGGTSLKGNVVLPDKTCLPRLILGVLVLIGCAGLNGCTSRPAVEEPDPLRVVVPSDKPAAKVDTGNRLVHISKNAEEEAGVQLGNVEERELTTDVNVMSEVLANANTQTHVTTPVTGRITQILVKIGDHIQEGKPLLIARSTDIQQSESDLMQGEQQVRSDLKQALVQLDCDIATAKAQLVLDEKVYQRMRNLFDERIASQADYQAAETAYYKDDIALKSLEQKRTATVALSTEKMKIVTNPLKTRLKLLGVSDAEIDDVMKTQVIDPMVPVLAPEDGIIVERLVNVGELIDPSKPLFTIGDFKTVWLKADVFEKDIPKVQIGQKIALTVESFPDRVFDGRLDYVANQVDSDTRTLAVRAEVQNSQVLLKPKMFGRMKILVGTQRVLSIPTTAVQDTRRAKVVYVPKGNNTFEERVIKLGTQTDEFVEVLEGLRAGEKVVTQGSFDLRAAAVKDYSS